MRAFLVKALGPGTTVDPVSVDGDRGWWISGDTHELRFLRPDGEAGQLPTRLAGDTLVFSRDGTLYRFETALGRDATLAIAESLPDSDAAGRSGAPSRQAGHPKAP